MGRPSAPTARAAATPGFGLVLLGAREAGRSAGSSRSGLPAILRGSRAGRRFPQRRSSVTFGAAARCQPARICGDATPLSPGDWRVLAVQRGTGAQETTEPDLGDLELAHARTSLRELIEAVGATGRRLDDAAVAGTDLDGRAGDPGLGCRSEVPDAVRVQVCVHVAREPAEETEGTDVPFPVVTGQLDVCARSSRARWNGKPHLTGDGRQLIVQRNIPVGPGGTPSMRSPPPTAAVSP